MPDFSLKEPNLTAEISWSLRIKDSIEGDGDGKDIFCCFCVLLFGGFNGDYGEFECGVL